MHIRIADQCTKRPQYFCHFSSIRRDNALFCQRLRDDRPVITKSLAKQGVITPDAAEVAEILWAFGALIGNSDMHNGNLSFVSEHGRPYALAPAYEMTPMSFAPTSSGRLPDAIHPITLHASVRNDSWRRAQALAMSYLSSLREASDQFNPEFRVCIGALATHLDSANAQINRLA